MLYSTSWLFIAIDIDNPFIYLYVTIPYVPYHTISMHGPYLPTIHPSHQIDEVLKLSGIRDRVWEIVACSAKTGDGLPQGESRMDIWI